MRNVNVYLTSERAHRAGRESQRRIGAALYCVVPARIRNSDKTSDRGYVVLLKDRSGAVCGTA